MVGQRDYYSRERVPPLWDRRKTTYRFRPPVASAAVVRLHRRSSKYACFTVLPRHPRRGVAAEDDVPHRAEYVLLKEVAGRRPRSLDRLEHRIGEVEQFPHAVFHDLDDDVHLQLSIFMQEDIPKAHH